MTKEETQKVRLAAKSLLHRLLKEQPKGSGAGLVQGHATKECVRSAVEKVLHKNLPESYDRALFTEKCDNVYLT